MPVDYSKFDKIGDDDWDSEPEPAPPNPVVIAPPGRLGLAFSNDARGHYITGLRSWSPLRGELRPGARIVSVNGEDTRGAPNERIVAVLARRQGVARELGVAHGAGLTVAQTLECRRVECRLVLDEVCAGGEASGGPGAGRTFGGLLAV